MDEFNFSEDEIREQLELLGYHNVPHEKLEEFQKDLEHLVKHERSKNSSIFSNETSSETGSEMSLDNHLRIPFDESNRRLESQTYNKSSAEHSRYGKENHRENGYGEFKQPPVKSSAPQTDGADGEHGYSLYSEGEQAQADARLKPDRPADVSIASTTSSDRKIIKRKVLRRKDGHAQVFDESVTESESDDMHSLEERLRNLPISVQYQRPGTAPGKPAQTYTRPRSASQPEAPYALPKDYEGPTALIRPMTAEPHTRNIKKCDPVSRFQQYNKTWGSQRAPGEKQHKGLRWNVREHMLYHDQVVQKKQNKVFVPNAYVVPSDKKRKNLRWQIRNDLAQGVKPPSMFDDVM